MFQKESLIKHYVFLFIDTFMLSISLVLANFIRFQKVDLRAFDNLYLEVYLVAIIACLLGNMMFHLDDHIFDRGYYQEFLAVIKAALCMGVAVLVYLYLTQEALNYSRLQLIYFFIFYVVLSYLGHLLSKILIAKYYHGSRSCKQIMLITTSDKLQSIMDKFAETNNWYFQIAYLAIVNQDMRGKKINGIPIIADNSDMTEVVKNLALDGVFINIPYDYKSNFDIRKTLHEFQSMGVIVHVNIDALELDISDKVIENLGFFKVVSYSNKLREPGQLIIKKMMDIVGSIIGILITLVVGIFVVPAIFIESPGKVIYSQTRVGKNGRHFKMYKFRSMYPDADKRLSELMNRNEMQGAMTKIKDDPRITKVGKFIRKYSIDELPQFFNVFKGDMSLVGTRPPLVHEVEKYRVEQKRRLSVTPGMTGLWQTSGRSDIYDFDEIVKLDLEYIDQWSIGLDIKLLVKTIKVCFSGSGAR